VLCKFINTLKKNGMPLHREKKKLILKRNQANSGPLIVMPRKNHKILAKKQQT